MAQCDEQLRKEALEPVNPQIPNLPVQPHKEDLQRTMEQLPLYAAASAAGAFGVTFFVLWIPRMWRGTLRETNQLSRAVQGKLDNPPQTQREDKHQGEGI